MGGCGLCWENRFGTRLLVSRLVSKQRPVGLSTYAELVVRAGRFLRKEDSASEAKGRRWGQGAWGPSLPSRKEGQGLRPWEPLSPHGPLWSLELQCVEWPAGGRKAPRNGRTRPRVGLIQVLVRVSGGRVSSGLSGQPHGLYY